MPLIVTVNVSVQVAPTPSTLQRTGAFISQGATTTAPGTLTLLTQYSDLTPVLVGAKAISSIAWATNTVTVTTSTAHGFTVGDTLYITISGASPTGYNGTFLCTVASSTTFTYALASNPGTMTAAGTYTPEDVAELNAMALTFFAQGASVPVYVLELGPGNPNDGIAYLTTWLQNNPSVLYGVVVPRTWDANANFLALIASYESTTSKFYFWVTTTLATYTSYTALMKDVFALIEAPQLGVYSSNALTAISWASGQVTATTTTAHGVAVGDWFQISGCVPTGYNGWFQAQTGTTGSTLVYNLASDPGAETTLGTLVGSQVAQNPIPSTEFSVASAFWVALHYNPSNTNKVAPFGFQYLFGVTAFPTRGMGPTLTALKTAGVNVVGTGAEGGISNTILLWGTTMDVRKFTYWYSVDWQQIQIDQALANAIINGGNNAINPLYLNQDGINRLQGTLSQVEQNAITFGLANGTLATTQLDGTTFDQNIDNGVYAGQIVINAVPFATYYTANPGDYKTVTYNGFAILFVPSQGFEQVLVNITVSDFITV